MAKIFCISPDQNLKDKQQRICQAMIGIVLSVHELVQTAFSPGACADAVTKVAVLNFYLLDVASIKLLLVKSIC